MGVCCVPGCSSSTRRDKGISFHEIPANMELRVKWIKVIARKDWVPNDTSGYSRVCSLHFELSDFKVNTKHRTLVPTAVPSIFPSYPKYMQRPKKKERSSLAIQKRENAAKKMEQKGSDVPHTQKSSDVARTQEGSDVPGTQAGSSDVPRTQDGSDVPGTSAGQIDEEMDVNPQFLSQACTSQDVCSNTSIPDQTTEHHGSTDDRKSIGTQVDVRGAQKPESTAIYWKNRCNRLKNRIIQLRQQAKHNKKNRSKPERSQAKQVQLVAEAASAGDVQATILIDQINNFRKKRPTWSETTSRISFLWKNCSPKGYTYAKNNNILCLPSQPTLARFEEKITESWASDLVTQQLTAELNALSDSQETLILTKVPEMVVSLEGQEYFMS